MKKTDDNSYYDETLVKLIEQLKLMVEECLKIVGQTIDKDLKDDKLFNALKAKRQAAEDAKWASKEVDVLIKEKNGEAPKNEKKKPINYAAQMAE